MNEYTGSPSEEREGRATPSERESLAVLAAVIPEVLALFGKVSPESRKRLLDTVAAFFGIGVSSPTVQQSGASFSEDRSISPKEFLREKQPRTDVERVACLAYYLTHYRDTPHFKTLDISQLNTEAAQVKFANAAKAVNNASSYGYLAGTTKGNKQLTASGEAFVEALPDRDRARQEMSNSRPRRRRRGSGAQLKPADDLAKGIDEPVKGVDLKVRAV